jgi:bacterioferritin-associated ferredoxin
MVVCHCREVTDRCIAAAIAAGARDPAALARRCGAGGACGGCVPALRALLDSHGLTEDFDGANAKIHAA